MKTDINTRYRYIIISAIAIFVSMSFPTPVHALSPDKYAENSVLSEGKWAKIKVSKSGMQFLSAAQLRDLGFTDMSKVNIYGYGGRMLSENLDDRQIDDLPQLPVIKTEKGILFFGTDNIAWQQRSGNTLRYKHIQHAYGSESFYFVSDRNIPAIEIGKASTVPGGNTEMRKVVSFTERMLHEQEIVAAGVSGRLLFGEDFRTTTTRNFQFSLPDIVDDKVTIGVRFAARTTNAPSSIQISANGTILPSKTNDVIPNSSSDIAAYFPEVIKEAENVGETLDVGIKYNPGGTLFFANLDYIEVEYDRALKLNGGELYFYLQNSNKTTYEVSGCNQDTQIWDVTDPSKPLKVEYSLEGDKAVFSSSESGYKEFIAFNPADIIRQPILSGTVANQNLHALPVPDMLIITPQQYKSEAQRIADLHAEEGMLTHVLSPEEIYPEFSSGTPDVSAFRKLMKMWYDRGKQDGHSIRYCLLMSKPTYDNKMLTEKVRKSAYPRIPIWQSDDYATGNIHHNISYSTDDYIGMLEDTEGSFDINSATINVAVGRMPVKNLAEAKTAVDKLYKYVKNPDYGAWRNNVMIIADDQDNGVHLDQAEDVYNGMRSTGNGKNFVYERLYLDSYPLVLSGTGPSYPDAKNKFRQKIAEGTMMVYYIGHGNPRSWTHEGFLNWTDITSFTNKRLPFYYTATCEFCDWDNDEVSGAEEMYLNSTSGAIGFISTNRAVYIGSNGTLSKLTAPRIFERDKNGKAKRVGDFYIESKNDYPYPDDNKLRYLIIGDPALKLASAEMTIIVDSIDGHPINGLAESDLPVLSARSTPVFSGYICDGAGNIDETFNGSIEVALYDAEKIIETYGNGSEGESRTYNDRKTKLYTGKANVSEGHWKLQVLLPSEIENNFSPALISLYAYDNEGKEANGYSEKFYVYGFRDNILQDNDGPVIKRFTLNSDAFKSGGQSNSSPVVLASFSDESGINISDAGIGHQLTLTLDNKTVYSDLSTYYMPETDDPTSGSVAYPLPTVEAGKHKLTLTAWDNANNSSSATLEFNVAAHSGPVIYGLTPDKNPATTDVRFTLLTDQIDSDTDCLLEVFDLNGRKLWSASEKATPAMSSVSIRWDLRDSSGHRVPRGIYLYRASLAGKDGIVNSITKKLAVTAQ